MHLSAMLLTAMLLQGRGVGWRTKLGVEEQVEQVVSQDEIGVSQDEIGVTQDEIGVSQDEIGVSKVLTGLYAALITLPATAAFDRMFGHQQRVTNRRRFGESHSTNRRKDGERYRTNRCRYRERYSTNRHRGGERYSETVELETAVSETMMLARTGLHVALEGMVLRSAFLGWLRKLDEMHVDELRAKLQQRRAHHARRTHMMAPRATSRQVAAGEGFDDAADQPAACPMHDGSSVLPPHAPPSGITYVMPFKDFKDFKDFKGGPSKRFKGGRDGPAGPPQSGSSQLVGGAMGIINGRGGGIAAQHGSFVEIPYTYRHRDNAVAIATPFVSDRLRPLALCDSQVAPSVLRRVLDLGLDLGRRSREGAAAATVLQASWRRACTRRRVNSLRDGRWRAARLHDLQTGAASGIQAHLRGARTRRRLNHSRAVVLIQCHARRVAAGKRAASMGAAVHMHMHGTRAASMGAPVHRAAAPLAAASLAAAPLAAPLASLDPRQSTSPPPSPPTQPTSPPPSPPTRWAMAADRLRLQEDRLQEDRLQEDRLQ